MKQLITILLCLFTLFAEAQVNTNDTNKYFKSYDYGFSYKRLQAREAFIMPTDTVINKLGAVSLNGAIYLGNGIKWTSIGGGGSSTDTTSLSNRINLKLNISDTLNMLSKYLRKTDTISLSNRINLKLNISDTSNMLNPYLRKIDTTNKFVNRLTRTPGKDSIIFFVGGNRFAIKDSVGGGGTTPTLQQVTTAGATSTNAITVAGLNLASIINFFPTGSDKFSITNSTNGDNILEVNNSPTGGIFIGGGTYPYLEIQKNPFVSVTLNTPSNSGYITTSVNGNFADASGNITIPTGGVAVDTIFRTIGKDSIFYKKNNITYAIKDSVGTNPAPVGYYGAFQDNTIQTAVSINTGYAVRFNTTDLSNGVSIVNNGGGNPTRVTISNAGIYNIQFSLQLEKISGLGNYVVDIWLRKNGSNIDGTTGKVVLTGNANASPVVAAWNYVVALSSNDYVELMWSTSNTNAVIFSDVANSPYPSLPSSILTVTQQSGIMAGTGISPLDTANMLLPYLHKIDTTGFQRKSISSYSILANNTSATANVTAQQFRDTSGVYPSGSISWTGTTAPSGATNHSYRLTQVGKCVTVHIALVFATNGVALTAVQLLLPPGAPTPIQPAGLTGSIQNMYPVSSQIVNALNQVILSSQIRGFLRNNTAANGFEIFIQFQSAAPGQLGVTVQYWTN